MSMNKICLMNVHVTNNDTNSRIDSEDDGLSAPLDWLQSLKQFFTNVSYHILEACLTLMALF